MLWRFPVQSARLFLSLLISICLFYQPLLAAPATADPIGILTWADGALVNEAKAYPGLSLFEGERLTTDPEGMIALRAGTARLNILADSSAVLHRLEHGTHVDLAAGGVSFATPQNSTVEVHAADALFCPHGNIAAQAEIRLAGPKTLLVAVRKGDLAFSYFEEFQVLPAGSTYKIVLDSPALPRTDASGTTSGNSGTAKAGATGKVAYFILAGVAAGVAGKLIYDAAHDTGPESPAKP